MTKTDRAVVRVGLMVLWPIVVTLPIAIVAPDNVLSYSQAIVTFVSILQRMIPNIDALAGISKFPEVTKLVCSSAYTLVPIHLGVIWRETRMNRNTIRSRPMNGTLFVLVLACVFWVFTASLGVFPPPEKAVTQSELLMQSMGQTRIALGFGAGFVCTLLACVAAIAARIVIALVVTDQANGNA